MPSNTNPSTPEKPIRVASADTCRFPSPAVRILDPEPPGSTTRSRAQTPPSTSPWHRPALSQASKARTAPPARDRARTPSSNRPVQTGNAAPGRPSRDHAARPSVRTPKPARPNFRCQLLRQLQLNSTTQTVLGPWRAQWCPRRQEQSPGKQRADGGPGIGRH